MSFAYKYRIIAPIKSKCYPLKRHSIGCENEQALGSFARHMTNYSLCVNNHIPYGCIMDL